MINYLKAAERTIMYFDPEVEGNIRPVVDGYKVLSVKFYDTFGREWEPTPEFVEWAEEHRPDLLK